MYRSFFLTLLLVQLSLGAPSLGIKGGTETSISNFPFQISLQFRLLNIHFCGGVVIGPKTVLTSASCMEAVEDLSLFQIVAGATDLKSATKKIFISDLIQHVNWNDTTVQNDIAILKLKEALVYSDNIQPAVLPEQDEDEKSNEAVKVSGYGAEGKKLYYADVNVFDRKECQTIYRAKSLDLSNDIICAGVPDNSKNYDLGDYGGPLSVNGKVVGLSSSVDGYPGVYTKVSSFRDWIRENSGI